MCPLLTRSLVSNSRLIPTATATATTATRLARTYLSNPYRDSPSSAPPPLPHSTTSMTVPLEGLMAINKPIGISSAEALRKLQRIFKPSSIFAETLAAEAAKRERESKGQQRRRRKQSARDLEVKIGHGGTLDPMASGVLVAGIGAGTKQLQQFLGCTKTYEATALFGAGTDTYDALGKIVAWGKEGSCGWERITEEVIEKELGAFRGDIMQKPPMFVPRPPSGVRFC